MDKQTFKERFEFDVKEDKLGDGSFGEVYKAYDHEKDVWVAIKKAQVKNVASKEFSLIEEVKATKGIDLHRNIANYEDVYRFELDFGIYDFAIMQYYSEGNLEQLADREKLNFEQKDRILKGLYKGVAFLHKNKILHRDLKPSNVLISKNTRGEYIPKIADFGLAKLVDNNINESIANSFLGGTLEYASPEQYYGHKLRFNADIWSLGVITYEVLLDEKPFSADGSTGSPDAKRAIFFKKIFEESIPDKHNECKSPYNKIIRGCLVKDPKDRYQKVEEILEEFSYPKDIMKQKNDTTIILSKTSDESTEDKTEVISKFDLLYGKVISLIASDDLISSRGYYDKLNNLNYITENKTEQKINQDNLQNLSIFFTQYQEGQKCFEKNLLDKAKSHFEKALKIFPEQNSVQNKVEDIQYALEEQQELESFNKLKKEAEKFTQKKKWKEAIEKYNGCLEIFPNNQDVIQLKKETLDLQLKEETENENNKQFNDLFQKANIAYKRGELENGYNILIKALHFQPKNRKALKLEKKIKTQLKKENETEVFPIPVDATKDNKSNNSKRLLFPLLLLLSVAIFFVTRYYNTSETVNDTIKSQNQELATVNGSKDVLELKKLIETNPNHPDKVKIEERIDELQSQKEKDEWNKIEGSENISNFEQYIRIYPNSKFVKQAEEKINVLNNKVEKIDVKLAYQNLQKNPSLSSINRFLSLYPDEPEFIKLTNELKVKYLREIETASFQKAKSSRLISELQNFITQYPKSKFVLDAKSLIAEINSEKLIQVAWSKTEKENTIEGYRKFIESYPQSIYSLEAKTALANLDNAMFKMAEDKNSVEAFQSYLKTFPTGINSKKAKLSINDLLDDIAWATASSLNTLAAYEKYINDFPNGKHIDNAKKEIDKFKPINNAPPVVLAIEKNLIPLQGGQFTIGCNGRNDDCQNDETPTKSVFINKIAFSKYELTQSQFEQVMGYNPSFNNREGNKCNNCPVENVSFEETQAFFKKLNRLAGNKITYRLPTEAEWEYAASYGKSSRYAGSNDANDVANYNSVSTLKVGSKKSNAAKIHDMSGNVAEWTSTWYDENAYANDLAAKGPNTGNTKVIRGGSFLDTSEKNCRIRNRKSREPSQKSKGLGFRIVKEIL